MSFVARFLIMTLEFLKQKRELKTEDNFHARKGISIMEHIVVTYSSKAGLEKEFFRHHGGNASEVEIPPDFFAEGDSQETIEAVLSALRKSGYEVRGVEADEFLGYRLDEFRPDLVFNIAEGLFGDFRESYVPMICEQLNIPYTGSDPLTLALCLNKSRTKEILSYHRIPNANFKVFSAINEIDIDNLIYPVIIKPVSEGSSKGIFNDSVIDSPQDAKNIIAEKLQKYGQPVIVEQFLMGAEFTVAAWGNGPEVEILPIISFNYGNLPQGARPLYSYEAKWIWDTPDKPLDIFTCPANLLPLQKSNIERVARKTFDVLNIRDWCRIDIRMDDTGGPNVLEVNPLPGILPKPEDNSCFPKAARTAGYTYEEMLNNVVHIAAKRLGLINEISRKKRTYSHSV